MDTEDNNGAFGTWDYVVLSLMLIISASIGVYYRFTGGKQKTTQEYLHGDKDLSVIPVAVSLMASFMSAITILGVSTENYTFGTQFVVINFGYGVATPFAAYCFLPVFFKMQATSAYQLANALDVLSSSAEDGEIEVRISYLEIRFGATTRLCTSLAFSLQMVLYMGIVLYAPAIALEAVTGISKTVAILSVGIVCTFYSTIGGMKAVVVTDVFQSLLMFAAVFMVIIKGAIDVGGLGEIWRIAKEGRRLEFDNTSPDPTVRHTWWSLILGGGFTYCSLYAVNQTQVQRLLTLRDLRRSQIALWLSWPVLTLLSLSTSFAGLAIYSKYHNCDPLKSGRISSSDQLMPLFVGDTMREFPGLCGLFVAGIFSGSLSTVSSALNSLAAVTLEDYLKGAVSGLVGGLSIAFWIGFGGPKPPPPTLPVSIESCFLESSTFGMAIVFHRIQEGLQMLFDEDPDVERSARVHRTVMEGLKCYQEIYKEKKCATKQPTICAFFQPVAAMVTHEGDKIMSECNWKELGVLSWMVYLALEDLWGDPEKIWSDDVVRDLIELWVWREIGRRRFRVERGEGSLCGMQLQKISSLNIEAELNQTKPGLTRVLLRTSFAGRFTSVSIRDLQKYGHNLLKRGGGQFLLSLSYAVGLNTTSALANYTTEAGTFVIELRPPMRQ
uniref:Sodium-dependent multivitamin transporter n=1 Tax=Timema shepardi TaxID=629360 RepID=A0A7R9FUW1_TIMSH|nr:unnamed protein product [Timema shepardi]